MSENEIFYGFYEKSNLDLEPEDTDEFFETEEKLGKQFVKVEGQLYSFEPLGELNQYGFSVVIPPSPVSSFICMWYNGGASIKEVVHDLIKEQEYG